MLTHYAASGYIGLARTAAPFETPEEAARALRHCNQALGNLDVERLGILLDWRLAPLATDARLHQFVVENTDVFATRFARRAILVSTPLGTLQTGRVMRAHSDAKPVMFNDEAEAISHVIG